MGILKELTEKSKDDLLFLVEESEAYYEGFVCFSHEAFIKRADMIFQTAFVDCSKLLKKDY